MPKIVAAAIKFYPADSEYPQVVCGKRHWNCLEWMFKHNIDYDKVTHVQGFLTNTDQFVDRYEAMNLALDWGQISEADGYQSGQQLFSEDLW